MNLVCTDINLKIICLLLILHQCVTMNVTVTNPVPSAASYFETERNSNETVTASIDDGQNTDKRSNGFDVDLVDLYLLGLYPMGGSTWPGGQGMLPASQMALDHINQDPSILPGYRLNIILGDSQVR